MEYLQYYVWHQIERQGKKYVCLVCHRRWSRQSLIYRDCPRFSDTPVYIGWNNTPEHLQTQTRLHRKGYNSGGPPRAAFRNSPGGALYDLYDIREAIPRPKPTIKQLINLRHPSVAGKWICHGCWQVFSATDKLYPRQFCEACDRKWPRPERHRDTYYMFD